MKKKVLAFVLTAILSCAQLTTLRVNADSIDEVKNRQAQTQSQYDAALDKIDTLTAEQEKIRSQMDSTEQELLDAIVSVESLKDSIEDTQKQIEDTNQKLIAAKAEQDKQYAAMKQRIQYLYEQGENGAWLTVLLEQGDISQMLSSVKQTQELYDYDEKALADYIAVVKQVEDLAAALDAQKSNLESLKLSQEAEQARLEEMLASLKASNNDYADKIDAANASAASYMDLIKQQSAEISQMEAQAAREAEAARVAQAEQAAAAARSAQAASEQAAAREAASAAQAAAARSEQTDASYTAPAAQDTSADTTSAEAAAQDTNTEADTSESSASEDTSSSAPASSGSGSSVVSFACQFIGNPYVWGGNSLTGGTDCSGFVNLVYAHFGISVARQSGALLGAGYGVSYSEAQPGDIICYPGHVAIYMGGGQIVHAANESVGITTGSATFTTILGVRRVL